MERVEQLKEIISQYWQLQPQEIHWGVPLNSRHLKNFSSLRMLRFLASVEEQFTVNIEAPEAITSFGDLLSLIEGQWARRSVPTSNEL